MTITNPVNDDIPEIHRLIGRLEGLVQHPVHFYKIMFNYFGNSFFIVKEAGRVIGFTWGFISQTDKDIFFLWQIGVSEEFRGKNLAQKLIGKLIEFAKKNNCKKIHATVETGNVGSWKMFEKMGFENASEGNTVVENGRKAIINYYGSGTNQILYEYQL
ncbi:MAG: GNAT family N-acetyltransferase [Bacteroidales bacterium]